MTPEEKIHELSLEMDKIQVEKQRLLDESSKYARKRDEINNSVRKERLEAEGYRKKRDELNSEIQKLKKLKEEIMLERASIIEQIKKLRKETKITKNIPFENPDFLKKEIHKIDWKIQTESLPIQEERLLVGQVKNLESRFKQMLKAEESIRHLADLEGKVSSLAESLVDIRNRIVEFAEESQTMHENMISKFEKVRKLRQEADEAHKEFINSKSKLKSLLLKHGKILQQVRALRQAIKELEDKEKQKKEASILRKVEMKALDKKRKGEKLSFEEFKILVEKGEI